MKWDQQEIRAPHPGAGVFRNGQEVRAPYPRARVFRNGHMMGDRAESVRGVWKERRLPFRGLSPMTWLHRSWLEKEGDQESQVMLPQLG